MTVSDPLTRLVMQAALLDPPAALRAWNEAQEISPIEDWSGVLGRPLPRIYLNLRHEPGFTPIDRMRGIYRAAWARNIVKLSSLGAVATLLEERRVPYRVIKGGAVCTLSGSWGSRSMGDLDIVVQAEHGAALEEVLLERGYVPLFPHRRGVTQGPWEDGGGGRLDVHPLALDSTVGRVVFRDSGEIRQTDGVTLRIPTAGASMVLAAGHAALGIAESDLVQGMVDVAVLEPMARPTDVAKALESRFSVDAMSVMLETLADLGWQPSRDWESTLRRGRRSTSPIKDLPKALAKRRRIASRAGGALMDRTVSPLRVRSRQPWLGRHLGYLMWVSLGHARPLESRVVSRRGGFLPLPPSPLSPDQEALIRFEAEPQRDHTASAWNVDSLDARFCVHVDSRERVRIAITCDDPARHPRTIYVNGVFFGWFPVDGNATSEFDITPVHNRIEVSFRTREGARAPWFDRLRVVLR